MQHLLPETASTARVMARALRHVAAHLILFALFMAATTFIATNVLPPAATESRDFTAQLLLVPPIMVGFALLGTLIVMAAAAWLTWRSHNDPATNDPIDADADLQWVTRNWRHAARRQWIYSAQARWIVFLLAVGGLVLAPAEGAAWAATACLGLAGIFLWLAMLSRFQRALRLELDRSRPLVTPRSLAGSAAD
jgi:lysylphosphatidylglycerol synthetase-like protein (DUF2156 family)